MKGFTHFVCGLAVASFFPWSVQAAAGGNPLYFLLGGTLALLPDTLDFRLLRYFYRHDIEVIPDPLAPDMQMVANAMAQAIDASTERNWRLHLHTIRMGPDCWQKYRISINPQERHVTAKLDDRIDTGGNPLPDQPKRKHAQAVATFRAPVALEYLADFAVEMFDGPHVECSHQNNGEIQIRFIPWHRRHTHSLCLSALLAGLAGILFGWQAAPVAFATHASHILLDQLGYMGSNLLWPITNQRFPGFKLQHASSAFWNLAAVWIAIALLYGNLHSHTVTAPHIPPIGFLIVAIILPLGIIHRWLGNET